MGIKQKEENTNGGLHNTLAAGTTVKGDIVTETDFRLDGKIEGDVSCSGKITTKSFFIIKSQNRRSVFSFNSVTSCFISDSRPYRNKTFTHVPSSKTTI